MIIHLSDYRAAKQQAIEDFNEEELAAEIACDRFNEMFSIWYRQASIRRLERKISALIEAMEAHEE